MKNLMLVLLSGFVSVVHGQTPDDVEANRYGQVFNEHCAVCHGDRLQGEAQGTPLVGVDLVHGETVADISQSIANGFVTKGMPAWSATFNDPQIKTLALYILESRASLNYEDFKYDADFVVPTEVIESELHRFQLQTINTDLDPLPFSIAPLPNGSILLTEKKLGLSLISAEGEKSEFIQGTPQTNAETYILAVKQEWGNGWLLDVATHPDYARNGWIYLQYGDRCEDCNEMSRATKRPVSMNKLIRGRIKEGQWIDEQVIWESDIKFYGPGPDLAAGGRIAFDARGHVFISVGMKGMDNHTGIQDLSNPWGKIHRVNDDGSIPLDNPFLETSGAIHSIWTFGHRSPQGLEVYAKSGDLWGTEMGPRGGDEVNRLLPGRNYGWPLYSKGVNYDGSPVAYGKKLGIEFDLKEIQQPVVDLTPSPAVSSFVFYSGAAFPQWQDNIIVGSLKARSLYRMVLENNKLVHKETLIEGLVRFRDIEVGADGEIYLLMENNAGGQLVKMVPAEDALESSSPRLN